MQDLNATMFYRAKFNIATVSAEQDLLWKVVRHIKECQASILRVQIDTINILWLSFFNLRN